MKFTIERSAALAAMSLVSGITGKKAIAILNHVMITAADQSVTFRTTNLDQEATVTAPAQVTDGGAYCLHAGQLGDIIRNAPDGSEISFEPSKDATRITIKAGRSRFNLPFLDVADFPTFPALSKPSKFQIDRDVFAGALGQCAVAMSRDATRYILNGVHIQADAKIMTLCGTDGHRLIKVTTPTTASKVNAVIPSDMVRETIKALTSSHGPDDASVEIDASKVMVRVGHIVILSKLIDGNFPDVERVIPKHDNPIATVDRDALVAAIRRASALSDGKVRGVRIEFKAGLAVLSSRGTNGDGLDEIDIDYDGDDVAVGFNSALLSDVLGAVSAGKVEIAPGDGQSPVSVKSPTDDAFTGVVMPLRV